MLSEIGLIGLGRMGRALAANMVGRGVAVRAWDSSKAARDTAGRGEQGIAICDDLAQLIKALAPPRAVMLAVPAGDAVEICLGALSGLLAAGDVIIDAGNSHYRDTERCQKDLAASGVDLVGLGVSGGPDGARLGSSLMAGGSAAAWRRIGPTLEAIAAHTDDGPCAGRLGAGGAGHFVKTVHNGIEYAIMQILADAFEILSQGCGMAAEDIAQAFHDLDTGASAGFLTALSAHVAAARDADGSAFLIDVANDRAGQTGTGRWAVEAALEFGVAVPTVAAAVEFRMLSAHDRLRREARDREATVIRPPALLRGETTPLLAPAIACAMASAFAQGFVLLAAATDRFGEAIDRRRVALIWRAGSILRGNMVDRIADAFADEPARVDLLGSARMRRLMADGITPLRRLAAAAISVGLPVPGLSSAVGYADASGKLRLSTRFVQLQRKRFGGHGFRRVGGEATADDAWREDAD